MQKNNAAYFLAISIKGSKIIFPKRIFLLLNSVTLAFKLMTMEISKRQKQVARLIEEEMSAIFQKEGLNVVQGGMISISKVSVTPDLLEARIHLSFFKINDVPAMLGLIKERTGEFRGSLGNRLRHHLRRIPELQFFEDDTLEHVSKIEALLDKVRSSSQDSNDA